MDSLINECVMNLSTIMLILVIVLKMVVGLVPHRVLGTSLGMDSGHTDVVGYLTGSFDGPDVAHSLGLSLSTIGAATVA